MLQSSSGTGLVLFRKWHFVGALNILSIAALLLLSLCISLYFPSLCFAQPGKKGPGKKSLNENALFDSNSDTPDGIGQTFNQAIKDSVYTELYDPITIANLRSMRDRAAPQLNSDDGDKDLLQDTAERALAIQTGRSAVRMIDNSDLRNTYRAIKESFEKVQERFRYSVQDTGESFSVSRSRKGKRLIEFNVEFSPRRVLEPQLRIGDVVRFRYDYQEKAPLLEYQVSF